MPIFAIPTSGRCGFVILSQILCKMIARYLQLLMKSISRRSWIEKGMTAHNTFNLIDILVIELWCNTGIHHVRFTVKHCHQLAVVLNKQRQNVRRPHSANISRLPVLISVSEV